MAIQTVIKITPLPGSPRKPPRIKAVPVGREYFAVVVPVQAPEEIGESPQEAWEEQALDTARWAAQVAWSLDARRAYGAHFLPGKPRRGVRYVEVTLRRMED